MAVSYAVNRGGALCRALLLSLTCCVPAPRPPPGPAPSTSFRQVPIGLCEDYPEESRTLAGARRDLELLESIGVDTLRISLGWDGIEPEQDRYDFAFWDAFVELAVDEYGLTLIPYVAYTPAWNSTGSPDDYWRAPPRDLAEFGELLALLSERYRGRIHSWEIWNEPDNAEYWTGSVAEYAALLRVGAAAVRGVDPDLRVVSGGLAGRVEFLEELFDGFGAAPLVDVVNLHSYYETWNPLPLETIPEYVAEVDELLERHGGRQQLWMAEVGYSNYRRGNRVSHFTFARFAHEHTLDYQAVALVRTLALLLSSPPISLVAWYELKDPPGSDAMIGDVNNRHLGVVFTDYRPKPALGALAFMNRLFGEGFRRVDERLRVEPRAAAAELASALQVHAFLTPRQTLVVIAWLGTLGSRARGPAGPAPEALPEDEREGMFSLWVPYTARGAASFYDAQGKRLARVSPPASAEGTQLQLALRGGDVQVIELPVAWD